jgi:hypothetical protein
MEILKYDITVANRAVDAVRLILNWYREGGESLSKYNLIGDNKLTVLQILENVERENILENR